MAEQTFKSPGFFEKEIDLSHRDEEITGVPAGIVGTAEMGPAFVPVTVGSFSDFEKRFGSLNSTMFGPYAVKEFLKNRTALTYVRVLGAGANNTTTDIENTRTQGTVKGTGFVIKGTLLRENLAASMSASRYKGCVQFLAGRFNVDDNGELAGFPEFTDNDSFNIPAGNNTINLIAGVLMSATGTRVQVLDYDQAYSTSGATTVDDVAKANPTTTDTTYQTFKIAISSSAGTLFGNDDGCPGIKMLTASLNPASDMYISKILNTDPQRFEEDEYLLYAHFPVENELASLKTSATVPSIGILSGSSSGSSTSGLPTLAFRNAFGRFDTRYTTPTTPQIISQPFGSKEFSLFRLETISDGAIANDSYKVSISNVRKSTNPLDPYGTFNVQVRNFSDVDTDTQVVEQYTGCTLNPQDSRYVAKQIGDYKATYDFDADSESERRLKITGKYPNQSSRVRVVMSTQIDAGEVPKAALPFGFRAVPMIKTSDTLTDSTVTPLTNSLGVVVGSTIQDRIGLVTGSAYVAAGAARTATWELSGSIVPPIPYRFKVTKGRVASAYLTKNTYAGYPGVDERVDSRLYWGTKFERVPLTGSMTNAALNANASTTANDIIKNFTRFAGIQKLDTVTTGAGSDAFNNNKFTLARVALSNQIATVGGVPSLSYTANSVLTGTAAEHILETAYIRNGKPSSKTYVVSDGSRNNRITFGTLAAMTSSLYFNKFSEYAKFTTFFYGGFDGVNILDRNMAKMNDKASSSDAGGMASTSTGKPPTSSPSGSPLDIGLSSDNDFGSGENSSIVQSYRTAARIISDPMVSRVNIIAVPGIRDSAITDYVHTLLPTYGKAIYVQDIPSYDKDGNRLYSQSSARPNVTKTVDQFESRVLDSNYSAVYFPDPSIDDDENNTISRVPASVAAIGALGYNDKVAYPWFAPAGFNRAALDFVKNVEVRLNTADRDELYQARINPIATFPSAGYVIFGQKTLQLAKSALDRVNVRRMLLEIKRIVGAVANKIVFEANTPETRARFVDQVTPLLASIQIQQGIDQFKVVMDSSNNLQSDIENNVLNGRIVVVPTRAVEFIAIDFIITSAGVSFE